MNYDSRKDSSFICGDCGRECNDQINANGNILEKATALGRGVSRAVKGRRDSSWRDPMMALFDLETGARTDANRMGGMTRVWVSKEHLLISWTGT